MPQSKDYKKTLMAQMDLNWDGVEELDEDEVPSEEEKRKCSYFCYKRSDLGYNKEGEEPE